MIICENCGNVHYAKNAVQCVECDSYLPNSREHLEIGTKVKKATERIERNE